MPDGRCQNHVEIDVRVLEAIPVLHSVLEPVRSGPSGCLLAGLASTNAHTRAKRQNLPSLDTQYVKLILKTSYLYFKVSIS